MNSVLTIYYIHTKKYSPKSYVVNFYTKMSSSQSEERTMFFTREKKNVQSKVTEVCEFHFSACSLQRQCFADIQRETFFS